MSTSKSERCSFARDEHRQQSEYFAKAFPDKERFRDRVFQLGGKDRLAGLMGHGKQIEKVFQREKIQWHSYIGHARSSQACCINFLMPFADKPEILSRWLEVLLGAPSPEVLPIERGPNGQDWFVTFEYTGPNKVDYLGEAGGRAPGRGANATAADAAVAFVDRDGRRQLLLIEWKYTEQYQTHRLSGSNETRHRRYADKLFEPNGPISDGHGLVFEDFLFEPVYQLVRQQMLAWQIEHHPDSGFDRVRVLHLSPSKNRALHHITAPGFRQLSGESFDDVFSAYRACLIDKEAFLNQHIEEAFGDLASWPDVDWYTALSERYPSLCRASGVGASPDA